MFVQQKKNNNNDNNNKQEMKSGIANSVEQKIVSLHSFGKNDMRNCILRMLWGILFQCAGPLTHNDLIP